VAGFGFADPIARPTRLPGDYALARSLSPAVFIRLGIFSFVLPGLTWRRIHETAVVPWPVAFIGRTFVPALRLPDFRQAGGGPRPAGCVPPARQCARAGLGFHPWLKIAYDSGQSLLRRTGAFAP
jgi:hypothetical protein